MASNNLQQNLHTSGQRIIAFFQNKQDAYRAISELKDAGFNANEIGFISRSDEDASNAYGTSDTSRMTDSSTSTEMGSGHDEGFWEKVKHFFSGDDDAENVDYRSTSEGMDWDQDRANYYYRGVGQGGALVSVTGSRTEEARRILQSAGGDLRDTGFSGQAETGTRTSQDVDNNEEYRMQLRGEVLRTYRDRVQRGEVRLRKEVVTENQTVDVPVTREELVIERVPGSGQPATAGEIGTDKEIRVPLTEERARVEKQPVINEEVRVGKRAVQSTEKVSGEVRREELRVDNDENVKVDNRSTSKGKKPAA